MEPILYQCRVLPGNSAQISYGIQDRQAGPLYRLLSFIVDVSLCLETKSLYPAKKIV